MMGVAIDYEATCDRCGRVILNLGSYTYLDGYVVCSQCVAEGKKRACAPFSSTLGSMTLRDYFAGQALAGLVANQITDILSMRNIADRSYDIAECMLAARKEANGNKDADQNGV